MKASPQVPLMELVIDLDEETYETLERRAETNEFESPEEYSRVVLRTVMEELEENTESDDVEQRLEDLGYLS